MKKLILMSLFMILSSCQYATLKYGYYINPLYVLNEAYESLQTNDHNRWNVLLINEAFTKYGSDKGFANMQKTLNQISEDNLKEPKLISRVPQKYDIYEAKARDYQGRPALRVVIFCETDRVHYCRISDIDNYLNPVK
jgi:hypothetical protein